MIFWNCSTRSAPKTTRSTRVRLETRLRSRSSLRPGPAKGAIVRRFDVLVDRGSGAVGEEPVGKRVEHQPELLPDMDILHLRRTEQIDHARVLRRQQAEPERVEGRRVRLGGRRDIFKVIEY